MKSFEKVKIFVQRHELLQEKGQKVLCAVSGGADSVCLLLMLGEMGFDVEVAHCNFHLRGEESLRDEVFVRTLGQRMGVKVHVKDFETEAFAQQQKMSIEMAARELRYAWFEQLRQEVDAAVVAVAHHRDDNVETLLLNLVRGTGLKGLCGIQPKNGHIIRPLLCLSRQEVLAYLKEKQQDYVVDSTNLSSRFSRNKLRLEVLPLLRDINPAVDTNILTTMENLEEVGKMYRYCVDEFVSASIDGAEEVNIGMVLRAPSPLSVLHEILTPFGFNRSQLQDMLRSIHSVGRTFLSPTHSVTIDREQLVISLLDEPLQVPVIRKEVVTPPPDFQFNPSPRFANFDQAKLPGELALRPVQPGDRFQPIGMEGTKLVSDFLTDLKLSRVEKGRQFVLTCDGEIAWVVGRRTSHRFKVEEETESIIVMENL